MKKVKHTYSLGDIVSFQFFDGTTRKGKIIELTYSGDNVPSVQTRYDMPTYKIRVDDTRGFTIYPSMTDVRINQVEKSALDVSREWAGTMKSSKFAEHAEKSSELDKAIEAQKNFLNR